MLGNPLPLLPVAVAQTAPEYPLFEYLFINRKWIPSEELNKLVKSEIELANLMNRLRVIYAWEIRYMRTSEDSFSYFLTVPSNPTPFHLEVYFQEILNRNGGKYEC